MTKSQHVSRILHATRDFLQRRTPFFSERGRANVIAFLRTFFWDIVLLFGCGVFSYGAWRAWKPLGFMVAGILLARLSLLLGGRTVKEFERDRQ